MKARLALALLAIVFVSAGCRPAAATAAPTVAPQALTLAAATAVPTSAPAPPKAPATATPTPRAGPLPVIFNDDGSPDGTTALFYLLSDPEVSVEAVTITYGEAHPAVYIQHMGRVLDELGRGDIPLGAGQDGPLAGTNEFPEALREGANNYWGLPLPNAERTYPAQDAAELMIAVARQAPEPVSILVTGPCTDLARALRMDPGVREHIAAVYIMGGAVKVPGNLSDLMPNPENKVAEWNVYADVQAAKEVFESGLDIYLVPLDATNQVRIGRQDTGRWRAGGRAAGMAADVYDMLMTSWGTEETAIWDLMTAAIMTRPELCASQPLHLLVGSRGAATGQTAVVAGAEPNVDACLHPDVEGIRRALSEVFSSSE